MSRRPYIRPVSNTTWYMQSSRYRRYILREVTCLLVGFYSFLTLWALAVLATGSPDRWADFLGSQQNPVMVTVHAVALIYFLVYMTFDWFKLAPKAMPVQLGEKKASDLSIIVAHYVVWALLTAFVAWLAGVIP